jgi:hypothetical protein
VGEGRKSSHVGLRMLRSCTPSEIPAATARTRIHTYITQRECTKTHNTKNMPFCVNLSLAHGGALAFETGCLWGSRGRISQKHSVKHVTFFLRTCTFVLPCLP